MLAACGEYLGEYQVENVERTVGLPPDVSNNRQWAEQEFLRIELSSATSLTALAEEPSDIDGIYVYSGFCPIRDPNGLSVFGPADEHGNDLWVPSDADPLQAHTDGRYRIILYLQTSRARVEARRPGQIILPAYDLREQDQDICMQLAAPGYHLIASRSSVIEVSITAIRRALDESVS